MLQNRFVIRDVHVPMDCSLEYIINIRGDDQDNIHYVILFLKSS